MEKTNRIILHLRGLDNDNGDVRLSEFIQQLDSLKKALIETEKVISDKHIAYYKIVELRKNSPAQIILEAVPINENCRTQTTDLIDKFFDSITEIDLGRFPAGFTYDTFEAYRDLTNLKETRKIAEIAISRNFEIPNKLEDFSNHIDKIIGVDEIEYGTYTGKLDAIFIHNKNIFYVYPTFNLPRLKCIFALSLKSEAIRAVGRYVTVSGKKKYKPNIRRSYPYEMFVTRIEIHQEENELPTLRNLKGIAPYIIENIPSEKFIREMRDEWE